jgi:hypothetical protein
MVPIYQLAKALLDSLVKNWKIVLLVLTFLGILYISHLRTQVRLLELRTKNDSLSLIYKQIAVKYEEQEKIREIERKVERDRIAQAEKDRDKYKKRYDSAISELDSRFCSEFLPESTAEHS